jgi:hypothetical protein
MPQENRDVILQGPTDRALDVWIVLSPSFCEQFLSDNSSRTVACFFNKPCKDESSTERTR